MRESGSEGLYRASSLLIDHQNPIAAAFITGNRWAWLLLTEKS
jgi:hypothetical protein